MLHVARQNWNKRQPFRIGVEGLTPSLPVAGVEEGEDLNYLVENSDVRRENSNLLTKVAVVCAHPVLLVFLQKRGRGARVKRVGAFFIDHL